MKNDLPEGAIYNNKYVIRKKIGEGLFSSVYLAENRLLSKEVILRIINSTDPATLQTYLDRFNALAYFDHPNIVRVVDIMKTEGEVAVASEYFAGDNLRNYLQQGVSVSHQQMMGACTQIASALDYAHSKGYGFLDIGADDILIESSGNTLSSHIISIDIVGGGRESSENVNRYILENRLTFGEMVYRVFTGKSSPFASRQVTGYVLARPSLENPGIPQSLDRKLLGGLRPNFEKNYKSCTDLIRALSSEVVFNSDGDFENSLVESDAESAAVHELLQEIAIQFDSIAIHEVGVLKEFNPGNLSGVVAVGGKSVYLSFEGLIPNDAEEVKPGSIIDFEYSPEGEGFVAQRLQVVWGAIEDEENRSDIRAVKNETAPEPQSPNIVEVNKPLVSITDQPSGVDRLNFKRYVDAFAEMVSNPELSTPITIGVYGQWGSGKSFLMGKIKEEIKERQKNKNKKVNIHVVEFNAWVYSGSEHLWASLVTHLYRDIEKHFGLREQWLRLRKAIRRSLPKALGVFSFYALLGLAVSLLLNFNELQTTSDTLTLAINAFIGSIIGGSALASLPVLWSALREFFDNLFLSRAKNLQNLAARPDFRNQIGVMADIKAEIGFIREILKTGKKRNPTRLVLFIDDLDRCEHRKAVEVLQAIMLLLADEDGSPFVVFLGIDARVVVRAIEEHYGKVLVKAGINGYEYLDKIIQVPFVIPDSSQADIENYVDSLLWESEAEKESILKKLMPSIPSTPAEPSPEGNLAGGLKEDRVGELTEDLLSRLGGSSEKQEKAQEDKKPEAMPAPPPPEEVPVTFTRAERETLKAHVSDLSSNPRKIKRVINIYRLARLILPREIDRTKAIRWILMTEQWPLHSAWIIEVIEGDARLSGLLSDKSVMDVYEPAHTHIHSSAMESLLSIDADPAMFQQFIRKEPVFTVQEIKTLLPFTFNLNPAIRSEVEKHAIKLAKINYETKPSPELERPNLGADSSAAPYRLLTAQE